MYFSAQDHRVERFAAPFLPKWFVQQTPVCPEISVSCKAASETSQNQDTVRDWGQGFAFLPTAQRPAKSQKAVTTDTDSWVKVGDSSKSIKTGPLFPVVPMAVYSVSGPSCKLLI